MSKKFAELRAAMSQANREKTDGMARQMLAEMPLNELRQARGLSQKNVGRSAACAAAIDRQDREAN